MSLPTPTFIGQTATVSGKTYQATSISPPAWLGITTGTHENRIEELESLQLWNANKYGANPDGVTVSTNAIRNACTAANGRVLTFVGGTYLIDEKIELKNTGGIKCLGDVTFKAAPTLTGPMFVFQEDDTEWLEDKGLLAASVDDIGEKAITLTDATGVEKGDELIIWDSATSSWSTHRANYYAGEFVSVDRITGSVVDTVETMYDAYPTNTTTRVYKHTGKPAIFQGFTLESNLDANQSSGLQIFGAIGLKLQDIKSNTWGYTAVSYSRSRYVKSIGLDIDMTTLDGTAGTNYGLSIGNSQDCRTLLCDIKSVRHAVAHGGGANTGSIVTRNSTVQGCTLYSTTTVGAADIHGNCENVRYINNTIDGGCILGGHNNAYIGNTIRNWEGASCILVAEPVSMNHDIKGNEAYVYGMASGRGGWFDCGGNTTSLDSDTVRDGTLTITGNKVDANGYDETGVDLIKIVNKGSTAVTKVIHKDNVYINTSVGGDSIFFVQMYTISGSALASITIDGEYDGAALRLEADNVTVTNAQIDGKFITKALQYPLFINATEEVEIDSVSVKNGNITPIYVANAATAKLGDIDINEYCRSTASSVHRAGILLQSVNYARLVDVRGRTTQADALYGIRLTGTAGTVDVALTKFTKSGATLNIVNSSGYTINYLVEEDIKAIGGGLGELADGNGVTGTATSANTLTIVDGVITAIT